MYRRSEGIIPNETYEQGNSSVNEVPHINRETIASNQPGFGECFSAFFHVLLRTCENRRLCSDRLIFLACE